MLRPAGKMRPSGRPTPVAPLRFAAASSSFNSSGWVPSVNTMGMGQLVRAIASLTVPGRPRPSSTWLQSFSEVTQHRLHHLRPRQLATLVRSIVALEHHPVGCGQESAMGGPQEPFLTKPDNQTCCLGQGEEWLCELDATCFSHPGPFDTLSAVKILASMAKLTDMDCMFPQFVYLKVMADPGRFDNYQELACLLHCLGSHNVPFWDESRFLDIVGMRMGEVLCSLPEDEANSVVALTLSKPRTLAAVLEI